MEHLAYVYLNFDVVLAGNIFQDMQQSSLDEKVAIFVQKTN